jgi:hypothetical protein
MLIMISSQQSEYGAISGCVDPETKSGRTTHWGVVSGEQKRNRPAFRESAFFMQDNTLENDGCSKMLKQNSANKRPFLHERAQAMVEFAITLPILMVLLVGLFEVGRMVFMYAAVNNASREAARYASAYGRGDGPNYYVKYLDCSSIRGWAKRSALLVPLSNANIQIQYFRPNKDANNNDVVNSGVLSESLLSQECDATSGEDPDVKLLKITSGDRVKVTITASYRPIVTLIPLRARTITSASSRTILGVFELDN